MTPSFSATFRIIGAATWSTGEPVSASNLRQQRRLWEALGRTELIKENNRDRLQAYAEEADALTQIIATRPAEHWEQLLRSRRVPVSRVQRMEAMLADEHIQGRKVLHRFSENAGDLAGLTVPVAAFQLSDGAVEVTLPPQTVGAQNYLILSELGYQPHDIEAMRRERVI